MGAEADPLAEEAWASFVYSDLALPLGNEGLDCVRRLVVADAVARFRRGRGDAVLFAPGMVTFDDRLEAEAAHHGVSPRELAEDCSEQFRQRCERLGVSCDWERAARATRPEQCRRAQRIFLALFEKGLAYRLEGSHEDGTAGWGWFIRSSAYAETCDRALDDLPGWTAEAVEAQREALGRVDGAELEAVLLGGGRLPVFTPFPDAVGEAAFIAMSPAHPEVKSVATTEELEELRRDSGAVRMAQTAMQAAIPGADALLPVVVTPLVDARFGPTACLGIPSRDDVDSEIAARLRKSSGLPFGAIKVSSKSQPSSRYRLPDRPISRSNGWGIPIPVAHCGSCGPVAVDPEELPAVTEGAGNWGEARKCPDCGGPAQPDPAVLDGRFDHMWSWLAVCVPPQERGSPSPTSREAGRRLPARLAVWSAGDAERFLDERVAGRVASDLGLLPELEFGESFEGALLCGRISPCESSEEGGVGSLEELDELVAGLGADAVRLTILHSAAASTGTSWHAGAIRHSQRFLSDLREYAELRLDSAELPLEIDGSTRMRRRLSAWCRVAEEKVSASFERMQLHRVTFDLMLFLKRIRDFEDRCADGGELDSLDRDALGVALLRLVRLAAPCVPHLAAEVEAIAAGRAKDFGARPEADG